MVFKNLLESYVTNLTAEYPIDPDWILKASKKLSDDDNFQVEYAWYTDGDQHIFVFKGIDDYSPDLDHIDCICADDAAAQEWFDQYGACDNYQENHCSEDLIEAMSEEDRIDSDILRSIIDKTQVRTNAKLTPEEKAVLSKYGLDRFNNAVIIPDARWYSISDDDISNPSGGNIRDRAGRYSSKDRRNVYHNDPSQVNYADIARKRGIRSKQRVDTILGDRLTKYANDRADFKNKKWYRDYHQEYVDQADLTYQAAIKKARDDFDKAVAAAEAARDKVDDYHRPEADRYAAEVAKMLGKTTTK